MRNLIAALQLSFRKRLGLLNVVAFYCVIILSLNSFDSFRFTILFLSFKSVCCLGDGCAVYHFAYLFIKDAIIS